MADNNWLRHKLSEVKETAIAVTRSFLAPIRRASLQTTDFTIISNNCWGGKVYMRYGLPYASPTVGLYFFADHYIKFIKNLKYYMSLPMTTIPAEESAYFETLKRRKQTNCPIGKLDDVEIVFLHYHSAEEAIEKWERRKKRINWDNLIVKFSEMNACASQQLLEFSECEYEIKFAFAVSESQTKKQNYIAIDKYRQAGEVKDDTTQYAKYININKLINEGAVLAESTPFLK